MDFAQHLLTILMLVAVALGIFGTVGERDNKAKLVYLAMGVAFTALLIWRF